MKNEIYPCLWFDHQAKEAADFYSTVFEEAKILQDSGVAVTFILNGQKFMGLNGGPMFSINPSISFFVFCTSDEEVSLKWQKLSAGGNVMMPLDNYPWSEKYGWCADRYGVNWQIMVTKDEKTQPIIPAFMFTQAISGKSEEAMQFYTSIFSESKIRDISRHPEGSGSLAGQVNHGRFTLASVSFIAFDGGVHHAFLFNEGISFVVPCDTQVEIDYYWEKLAEGGQEGQCGWIKDKYGVSWQVVPAMLGDLMSDIDKAPKVMESLLKMKKIDIPALLKAAYD